MKNSFMKAAASAALAVLCSVPLAVAQTSPQSPDNSRENQNHAKTADSQPNAAADRATTAKVRKAIVADKGLSTYAHNVKIITMNGQVTLKGPVKSEEEKQQIASDVTAVVSADSLSNQLTVKQ